MKSILPFIKAKKIWFIICIFLVVILIGRVFLLQSPKNQLIYTVKRGSLLDTVQVSGTFTTAQQKQIISPATGIISQLYVSNNDLVKKGSPLFHVESTATENERVSAYADYQAAISDLKTAQQTKQTLDATMWTKQKALLDAQNNQNYKNKQKDFESPKTDKDYNDLEKRSVDSALFQAQKDFDVAQLKYKEADISISAAAAKVTKTKLAYDQTKSATITAPADGTVVNLLKRVGDEVSTAPVLMIVDFSNPVVTIELNEAYMSRIAPGQRATIIFDSLKSKTFSGFLETIDTVGTDVDGATTYNARVIVSDLESIIKPNMTALVTIETLRKDNVLTVPNSAIIEKDRKTYVRQANRDKETLIDVSIGTKGLSMTEIIGGLSEGIEIVANEVSELPSFNDQ